MIEESCYPVQGSAGHLKLVEGQQVFFEFTLEFNCCGSLQAGQVHRNGSIDRNAKCIVGVSPVFNEGDVRVSESGGGEAGHFM